MAKKTTTRKPPRLSAAQRAADRSPLYDPAQTLAGHRLSDAADSVVNAQFGPKLAAVGREARSAETQGAALTKRAHDYFGQLADIGGAQVAGQTAIRDQLRTGLANVATTSGKASDASKQDVMSRLAADVANRGTGLGGGGDQAVLDELAAQRARGADTAGAFQSAGELQGGRAVALQEQIAGATQQHGGEVQGQLLNRVANNLADIRAKRSDLEAQRGDERIKQILGMRQTGFENLVTSRGLGIKQSQLAADIANQQTQAELAAQRAAESQRHNVAGERNQRSSTRMQGQSLAERQRHNSVLEHLANLRVDLQAAKQNGKGPGGKESQSAVKVKRGIQNTLSILEDGSHSERYLTRKVGVPPDVMQAAKDLKNMGYLQYDTVRALETLGVQVPQRWRPPRPDRTAPH